MDKEAKIKEKKKIILEALKRCLEKNVYSNITVQEVATEAGFSKGGLLHYFPSKEDMYLELLDNIFLEIQHDHLSVLHGSLRSNEKASLSALFGIEKFFMDKRTVKIFLNLLLYSFEDEEIAKKIREFIRNHRKLYEELIEETRVSSQSRRKTDVDSKTTARIAQIIVLASGVLEAVDSTDLDHINLVKYLIALFKG